MFEVKNDKLADAKISQVLGDEDFIEQVRDCSSFPYLRDLAHLLEILFPEYSIS